jgi:hypothetical protein
LPFNRPVIDKVISQEGDNSAIVYNSRVNIHGQKLKGQPTKVTIGGVEVALNPTDTVNTLSDTRISLLLNSSLFSGQALRAGIQGVSILHPMLMGVPEVEHFGFESNVKPMIFCPTITGTLVNGTDKTLQLTVNPKIGKTQRVLVMLNEFESVAAIPKAYSIKAPDNNGVSGSGIETDSVTFSISDVIPGKYLARIQVDSAESPLTLSGLPPKYTGPQVVVL